MSVLTGLVRQECMCVFSVEEDHIPYTLFFLTVSKSHKKTKPQRVVVQIEFVSLSIS